LIACEGGPADSGPLGKTQSIRARLSYSRPWQFAFLGNDLDRILSSVLTAVETINARRAPQIDKGTS
jgi:hypothetical protein